MYPRGTLTQCKSHLCSKVTMSESKSDVEIDDGHRIINDLVKTHRTLVLSDANEANTRAKVIDWTLRRVLGWHDDDLQWEERVSEDGKTTFADYLITTANTSVIVEAKKAGATFSLPTKFTSAKLGGVLSEGDIGDAIRQARDYCRGKSVQFAAVTNGSAWVVFPAVRTDGVPFEDTQASIFRSLEDIQHRFVDFWEILSRQRVIEGNLEHMLLPSQKTDIGRRPMTMLRDPEFKLGRNSLYPFIEEAVTRALTDQGIEADPDALRECYVQASNRIKFDSRLRMYLADAKPPIGRSVVRVKTKKSRSYLKEKIVDSKSSPARFFLLLGQVGAGKSTFLRYTRRITSNDVISGKILWLPVDFIKATESNDPRAFLFSELLTIIEDDTEFSLGDWQASILPSYQSRIDALARGPLYPIKRADPQRFDQHVSDMVMQDRTKVEPYVEALIKNAVKSRPGFLIVDNVDQINNDRAQSKIFGEVQAAAQRTGLNVIMALRDATYIRSRNFPVFDAFQFDSIYVDPPSVIPVLSRRFQYAKKLLSGKSADLTLSNGIHLKVEDLGVFFDIVAHSLLADDAAYMLDVLSGGDIRRGLMYAREFLSSGHTTADWALHNYLSDRKYRFALHEIFKGATLGGRKFYREEDSLLPNIFSSKLGTSGLQLLRLHLVHYLVSQAQSSSFEGTLAEKLVADLHQLGVSQADVEAVLYKLLETRVIRTTDNVGYALSSRLLPTRLAGYVLTHLACQFNYVEMCIFDTTIYDEQTWGKIGELTATIQRERDPLKGMPPRIERVKEFVRYLQSVEERWAIMCRRHNLSDPWGEQVLIKNILPALTKDFASVMESVERQRVRRQGYTTH